MVHFVILASYKVRNVRRHSNNILLLTETSCHWMAPVCWCAVNHLLADWNVVYLSVIFSRNVSDVVVKKKKKKRKGLLVFGVF